MRFDPNVWGPHYWFMLHTIALSFPENPTQVVKKKYYQFFNDFALFIPETKSSKLYSDLIEKYPVNPYLDTKMNLFKWTHFIHNHINSILGKSQVSYYDALEMYYDKYKPKETRENREKRERLLWISAIIALVALGVWMGQK